MTVKVEKMDKSRVLLEITVEANEVTLAYNRVAKKAAGDINVPGFRKGKAPRHIIEKYTGNDYLQDRAIEMLMKTALFNAYHETEILPVSVPSVEVVQIEEGKDFIFKATVEVKPEVELGEYMGLEVEKETAEVTDEQVDQELKRRQDMHAKVLTLEEGEVLEQDIVSIDFEGFVDNVPFEGGNGENFELTIGSGMFIPGFEEQLKGTHIGQEVEINVPFPGDYQNQELAGKDSMFKVKINSIKRKELSELDDEFAKDISEFDTLAELKEDIKQKILEATEKRLDNEYRSEMVKRAVDNASVEIPEGMIQERIDSMFQDMETKLASQGLSMQQYYEYLNSSKEAMRESYCVQAAEGIKTELVLEAIAEKEDIFVTVEELDKEIDKLAAQYGRNADELRSALISGGQMEWFRAGLLSDRVIDLIIENASEKKDMVGETENTISE